MLNGTGHIVSKFGWDTRMEDRKLASELQRRISSWSKEPLNRELTRVFDKLCPEDQIWRIDKLEIDLGVIDFDNLEREFNQRLGEELAEQLIQLTLKTYQQNNGIEIIDRQESELKVLEQYFQTGYFPWSYRSEFGTLDDMILHLLRTEHEPFINMVRGLGRKEKVRKRMAWQIKDNTIRKVIKGLEPNNYETIIGLSDELVKLRKSASIVQTETAEFRKNVWWWILNFLLTERGTLFNKIAFTKSVILQTANHYNIDFKELLNLIQKALELIAKKTSVRSDFMVAIQAISDEKKLNVDAGERDTEFYWNNFREYLEGGGTQGAADHFEMNEQIKALFSLDPVRFTKLLSSGLSKKAFEKIKAQANTETLRLLFSVYAEEYLSRSVKGFETLFRLLKEEHHALNETKYWTSALDELISGSQKNLETGQWLIRWTKRFAKQSSIAEISVIEKLEVAMSTQGDVETERYIKKLYLNQLRKKAGLQKNVSITKLLDGLLKSWKAGKIDDQQLEQLKIYLVKSLEINPSGGFEELIAYLDKEGMEILLSHFISDDLIHRLVRHAGPRHKDLSKIHKLVSQALKDLDGDSIDHDFAVEFAAVVSRLYISKGGKLEYSLLERAILIQAKKTTQGNWEVFVRWVDHLMNHLEAFMTISESDKKILNERLKTIKETGFLEKWEQWKDDPLVSEEKLATLLEHSIDISEFRQLNFKQKKEFQSVLAAAFPQIGLKNINQLMKVWADFESAYKLKLTTESEKLDVLFKLMLTVGTTITIEELIELLSQHLYMRNGAFSIHKIRVHLSGKDLEDQDLQLQIQRLREALKDGKSYFKVEGEQIEVIEFLYHLLMVEPLAFSQLLEEWRSEKHLSLMIERMGLSEFLLQIGADPLYQKSVRAVSELYQLLKWLIPSESMSEVDDQFSRATIHYLAVDQNEEKLINSLIDYSLQQIITITELGSEQISREILERGVKLAPVLIEGLITKETSFLILQDQSQTTRQDLEVDELSYEARLRACKHLIRYGEFPLWITTGVLEVNGKDARWFLEELGTILLLELRRNRVVSVENMKIDRLLSFTQFVDLLVKAAPQKSIFFGQLNQLYQALEQLDVGSNLIRHIKHKMHKDLLRSWINDQWDIFSADRFWKELIWELSQLTGYREKELAEIFVEIRLIIPAAFRLSLDKILEGNGQKHLLTGVVIEEEILEEEEVWEEEPALEEEGIHVKNAGLVLLNNYVSMLFERAGLIEDDQFVDDQAQGKAVHYLQFAGTANTDVDEGFLALNKVLCGLHPTELIRSLPELDSNHQELINGMITAMSAYWTEIGETSVMGFRGNWLVRDGLLIELFDRWELTVEKRPYDILLNQAPFSFSIIRYPWMKKPLHVNWSY